MRKVTVWRRTVSLAVSAGMILLAVAPMGAGPFPAFAQDSTATRQAASPDSAAAAAQANEYLKTGEYDKAIQVLDARLQETGLDPGALGETYLLLIKTLVLVSNDSKNKGQFTTSELYLDKARDTVVQALSNPVLAYLRPKPEIDFPPEMVTLFRDVRATTFGSFQVASLQPSDARVYLDSVLVQTGPSGLLEAPNVRAGDYRVRVEAPGYRTRLETISILPGTNQSQEYILKEKRGFFWYAARGAILATGLVVAAVVGNNTGSSSTTPDLPGPPAPPGN